MIHFEQVAGGHGKGLWEQHRVEDVATPEVQTKGPSAAHIALARLDHEWSGRPDYNVLILTQNVDDLHERSGAAHVHHMQGELLSALCSACLQRTPWIG